MSNLYTPEKIKTKKIKNQSIKPNLHKDPKIKNSEKKDIKGGTPKLRKQEENQSKQKRDLVTKNPLRSTILREPTTMYISVIRKNNIGEINPWEIIIKILPKHPENLKEKSPNNILLMCTTEE